MATVGIRELKAHTSEILRRVREGGETIDITYRGEVVASISPKRRRSPAGIDAAWEHHDDLVRDIARHLGDRPIDVLDLLDAERRDVDMENMPRPNRSPTS